MRRLPKDPLVGSLAATLSPDDERVLPVGRRLRHHLLLVLLVGHGLRVLGLSVHDRGPRRHPPRQDAWSPELCSLQVSAACGGRPLLLSEYALAGPALCSVDSHSSFNFELLHDNCLVFIPGFTINSKNGSFVTISIIEVIN